MSAGKRRVFDRKELAWSEPSGSKSAPPMRMNWISNPLSQPGLRLVLGTALWLQAEKIWQMGLGFVVGVWMARSLGPSDFGVWSLALAVASIAATLGRLGLDMIAMREYSVASGPVGRIVGSALVLRLLGTMGFAALAALIVALFLDVDSKLLPLLALILPAAVIRAPESIEYHHIVHGRGLRILLARGGVLTVGAALKIALIVTDAPLWTFGASVLIESGLLGIVFLVSLKGAGTGPLSLSWGEAYRLVRAGVPLLLSAVGVIIYMRVDAVMLGALAGVEEVGIYAVAVRLSEIWYLVPISIVHATVAPLSRARRHKGAEHYELRFRQQLQGLILFLYPIALATTFLATPLIQFVYGPTYSGAAPVLSLYIWSAILIAASVCSNFYLVNGNLSWDI